MTQIFDEAGRQIPVTVILAGPCHVTQVRTVEKDGYAAIQLGFEDVPARKLTKPVAGHQKGLAAGRKADLEKRRKELAASMDAEGVTDDAKASIRRRLDALEQETRDAGDLYKRKLMEFESLGGEMPTLGTAITVEMFAPGEQVKVYGTSKGKGFAGVVKRFGFHGGDKGHGGMVPRKPQSSGATDAARTFRGTRKPGHMGHVRETQRGVKIVRVDIERNLLLVKGSIPGPNQGLVVVSK